MEGLQSLLKLLLTSPKPRKNVPLWDIVIKLAQWINHRQFTHAHTYAIYHTTLTLTTITITYETPATITVMKAYSFHDRFRSTNRCATGGGVPLRGANAWAISKPRLGFVSFALAMASSTSASERPKVKWKMNKWQMTNTAAAQTTYATVTHYCSDHTHYCSDHTHYCSDHTVKLILGVEVLQLHPHPTPQLCTK